MKELNQAVYYTTAQVTELVDLSDQNVRKYVRLLEDRKYEVAKDEHNRRLFSANDVLILRELIKKAKKPGYTIESAADEIVNETGEIISSTGYNVSAGSNDNDIKEMFAHVIERLDAIQDENRDLKDNIRNLVERLEQYDRYNSQRYLESTFSDDNNAVENDEKSTGSTEQGDNEVHDSNVKNDVGNYDIERTDNDIADVEDDPSEAEETQSERIVDEAPSVSESSEDNNIDMSEYSREDSETTEKQDDEIQKENSQSGNQNEGDKEGFLSSLFKMFKK